MAIDVSVIGIEYRTDGLEKGTRALHDNEKQANKTADAADKLIEKLKRQAETYGMTEAQIRRYDIAQLKGTATQQKAVAQYIKQIEANDRLTKSHEDAVAAAKKFGLIIAGGVAGAIGAVVAINKLIEGVAKYQDIAEKTGGSASGFASLRTAADVAGTSVENVAHVANRLSVNLSKVDGESKGAGKALAAIGIELEKFRNLRPDEQLREVGKALNGYADGAGKAAIANQLFGRGGAEMLPFLKELGNETRRMTLLTDEQIRAADDYADANARAMSEIKQLAEATAMLALPAMSAFQGAVSDTIKDILGLSNGVTDLTNNNGIQEFAFGAARALAFVIDQIDLFNRLIQVAGKGLNSLAMMGWFKGRSGDVLQSYSKEIDAIWSRPTFGQNLEKRIAEINSGEKKITDVMQRNQKERELKFSAVNAGGGAGRGRDPFSEAKRYLETLQRQLDKTRELTVEETTLSEIRSGRIGKVSAALEKQLLDTARLIDLQRAEKDSLKASEQAASDAASAAGRLVEESMRYAQAVEEPFEKLQRQLKELESAVESNPLIDAETAARLGTKYWQEYLKSLEGVNKEINQFDEFSKRAAQNIQDSIGQGLVDLMEGNYKNIGDGFVRMINRMVAEAAAANLSRYLFGSMVGGTGDGVVGSLLSTAVSALFGVPSTGAGLTTGDFARMDRMLPSAKGNAFDGSGVIPFANGGIVNEPTLFKFARGTGLMGEAGPEAIMPLKRDADGKLGVAASGGQMVQHISFTVNGPITRETQQQIAARVGAAAQRAVARNT